MKVARELQSIQRAGHLHIGHDKVNSKNCGKHCLRFVARGGLKHFIAAHAYPFGERISQKNLILHYQHSRHSRSLSRSEQHSSAVLLADVRIKILCGNLSPRAPAGAASRRCYPSWNELALSMEVPATIGSATAGEAPRRG